MHNLHESGANVAEFGKPREPRYRERGDNVFPQIALIHETSNADWWDARVTLWQTTPLAP